MFTTEPAKRTVRWVRTYRGRILHAVDAETFRTRNAFGSVRTLCGFQVLPEPRHSWQNDKCGDCKEKAAAEEDGSLA